ncbi:hypothetical protein BDZ90DRAFT_256280 [Jaminaea rosea]|uniref:B-related factor 1 n=1 Tax=Jaminaea rosea TaxID=1569628 RepID=A0A316UPE5_9BASI|nr:hypothetical protein BDZ90DRAFT_256280 [Jaminaea rosea]PWN25005.1 hypothetical protein BDZ90DRAFT_256280 [Jaminaea rosea]
MRCPQCHSDNVEFDNSQAICQACGNVLAESQIVSDVTFGETSAGAATVQGSYLSQDQSHVRSSNPRFRSGGSGESREQTHYRAKEAIDRMGRAHRVGFSTRERANRMFRLALAGEVHEARTVGQDPTKNFVLGRKHEYTVAACLYVACRMDKTTHMLIDFADSMNINVFTLGRHYLKLIRALNLQLPVIDPAIYILRFAALLHFGEEVHRVAADATRLVKRFDKDWIIQGRRPAGVCGAALLLAARMNNFRRSMNEIVQVVKMADVTIRERLKEFKRTPTAQLSVADFKKVWLESEYEPPAFYRPAMEEERKAQKEARALAKEEQNRLKEERKAERLAKKFKQGSAAVEDEGLADQTGEQAAGEDEALDPEADAMVQRMLQDEMGQYIDDPRYRDLDQQLEQHNAAAMERARLGGATVGTAPELEMNEFRQRRAVDEEDEDEDGQNQSGGKQQEEQGQVEGEPSFNDLVPKESATQGENHERAAGPSTSTSSTRRLKYSQLSHGAPIDDPLTDLDEDELDQFILGPEEVAIKERVWMEFNHDYLVAAMKRQLKEEADEKAGIRKKRTRKPPPKPRDASTATGATAEEAARAMMEKKTRHQPKSRKINYNAMAGIGSMFDNEKSHKKKKKGSKKKGDKRQRVSSGGEGSGTEGEATGARGATSELEPVEEEGDEVPRNDPRRRTESKANRKRKASSAARSGGATSEGEDTGGETTDLGTQRGDTDGGEDGEADEGDMEAQMRARMGAMYSQPVDDYEGEEAY